MSNQVNTIIQEAAFEDFIDLFNVSGSFRETVQELFSHEEAWKLKECDCEEDALIRIFDDLWNFDMELLVTDKRTCVEALLMYKQSMKELNRAGN